MQHTEASQQHARKTTLIFDPEKHKGADPGELLIKKKRVAAYARVSTELDAQQSSYEAQIDYYTSFISQQPEWEFVKVYADEGISGTSYKNRDGFNQMVADAKAGKIDLILTKSISRFARNTVDALSITRELKAYHVEVRFEKENISSMDPQAELIFTIMSSIAQEESRSISENVRWGRQRSMEAGKVSLAWSSFLGYEKGENGLPKIVEEEANIIRHIFQMYLDGLTITAIAKRLTEERIKTPMGKDRWRPEVVRSILKNEKYKGDAILQKTFTEDFLTKKVIVNTGQRKQWYIKDSHDAIIKPEIFDLVQEKMKARSGYHGKHYDSPFTGMIKCGICGNRYSHRIEHRTRKTQTEGWCCLTKIKSAADCSSRMIKEAYIKAGFVIVCDRLLDVRTDYIEEYRNVILPEISDTANLERKIEAYQRERLDSISLADEIVKKQAQDASSRDVYEHQLTELTDKVKKLGSDIDALNQEIRSRKTHLARINIFLECLEKTGKLVGDFDSHAWHALVEDVIVTKDLSLVFRLQNGRNETVTAEEINSRVAATQPQEP